MIRSRVSSLLLILVASFFSTVAAGAVDSAAGSPYLNLKPAFTINVGEPGARLSFAKVDVALRLKAGAEKERVEHHQPQIRDLVVSLLSNQPLEKVESGDSREALRSEALAEIQAFLQNAEGDILVSDLLFTSFIVQR